MAPAELRAHIIGKFLQLLGISTSIMLTLQANACVLFPRIVRETARAAEYYPDKRQLFANGKTFDILLLKSPVPYPMYQALLTYSYGREIVCSRVVAESEGSGTEEGALACLLQLVEVTLNKKRLDCLVEIRRPTSVGQARVDAEMLNEGSSQLRE